MRRLLSGPAAAAASQLLRTGAPTLPSRLGLSPAGALGVSAAVTAAGSSLWVRGLGGSPAAGSIAGLGGMAAAEASFFAQHGEQSSAKDEDMDLGDLKPGMTLSEEEDDEAEHYAVRAVIHRRRVKPREEHHLDEEDPPPEEAPGEEAYKEAGPLLPPDSEEEDIMSDEELEARKR